MENFDVRSFLVLSSVLGGGCLVFLLTVIRMSFPKSIGGVPEWIWACGLSIISAILFSNHIALPTLVSRWLANTALLFGLLMMYISLRKFARFPVKHRPLLALVCAVVAGLFWNSFVHEDYDMRTNMIMLADVVLCAACVTTLGNMKNKSIPEYFTMTLFALLALMSLGRLVLVNLGLEQPNLLDVATVYQKLYVSAYVAVFVALMFGFMLIVSRRLRKTLMYLSAYSDFDGRAREESWQLGRDLRRAIANDELVMHHQPRINIRTGELVAVEALLRWNHPSQGLLTPNKFIDAAEGTDAIRYIGEWVVRKAVDSLNQLHRVQPGIRMSLNMSPRQLAYANFVPLIAQALLKAEFDPSQLELELTESVVMDDPEEAETMMWDLKKLGVRLSIDDFGTGYSSLSYLKRLPVDCVKIDRSFIKDIPGDEGDVAITKAIIAMGHALGLSVVAEGVETAVQLAFLSSASCDEYQGYLFSRPLPQPELLALLQDRDLRRSG